MKMDTTIFHPFIDDDFTPLGLGTRLFSDTEDGSKSRQDAQTDFFGIPDERGGFTTTHLAHLLHRDATGVIIKRSTSGLHRMDYTQEQEDVKKADSVGRQRQ